MLLQVKLPRLIPLKRPNLALILGMLHEDVGSAALSLLLLDVLGVVDELGLGLGGDLDLVHDELTERLLGLARAQDEAAEGLELVDVYGGEFLVLDDLALALENF